jgi:hypothetical protein
VLADFTCQHRYTYVQKCIALGLSCGVLHSMRDSEVE